MTPALRRACVTLTLVASTGWLASGQIVFRSSVASVSVDVTVQQRGRDVTSLTAADFELLDNGLPQRIVDVSREALPVDVTLVIDSSGSVSGPLQDAIRRAMAEVGERLRDIDRTAVIEFNHAIREARALAPRTQDRPFVLSTPSGSTSLFDAMTIALATVAEPGRRRMAIVLTDGRDDASFTDADSIIELAKRSPTAVFTVAVAGGTERRPERAPHERLFADLAEATGGSAVVIQADQDLSTSFVRAFDQFRTSYVLRYAYDGPAKTGWHAITVRITRPGTFEIRAREGYVAAD